MASLAMNSYAFYVIVLLSAVAVWEIPISRVTHEYFNNPFSDIVQVCENTYLIILLE